MKGSSVTGSSDETKARKPLWKLVLAGLAALFSGQLISIVDTLAVVPIFLAHWSVGRYGEWLALSSLVSYVTALDLGMNTAGTNRLTQEYAKGNLVGYHLYLRSAIAFYICVAAAGTALLAALLWVLPVSNWLGLRLTDPREASAVAFLLGSQILWSMPVSLTASIYKTTGDLSRTQWVRNSYDIGVLLLTCLFLARGGGMIALAVVQVVCLGVAAFVVVVDIRRRHPALMPGISGAKLSAVRDLVRPSMHFGLIVIATAISVQGPILLISGVMGGTAVAIFSTARTLANVTKQVVTLGNQGFWPHLTALEALEQHSRVRLVHRLWVFGGTALCISLAAALWFEGADVIRVWTNGRISVDPVLLRLLLLQIVLQTPWIASGVVTGASNRHARLSYAYVCSSALGLAASALLLQRMALRGIPVGMIIGEAIVCYHFVLRDTCSKIGESYPKFAVRLWLYVTFGMGVAVLAGWSAYTLVAFGPSLARWLEVGCATSAVSAVALWYCGLDGSDRQQVTLSLRRGRASRNDVLIPPTLHTPA